MARRRRRRRPGGHTTAVGSGGRLTEFILPPPHPSVKEINPRGVIPTITHQGKYALCVKVQGYKLPLWRGAGGGGVLAGIRRQSAAGDSVPPSLQIPPHTHILLARSPTPYSPFRRRAHSPTAFSGPMARPPPFRVLLPHTCTQDGWFLQPERRPARLPRRTVPSNCICRCSRMRARLPLPILLLHTQVSR